MAAGRRWTFEALLKSSGKLATWRKNAGNYASSTKRIPERSIPSAGTKSILMQFSHWGLTEEKKIHRVHLQFYGLQVYLAEKAPDDARDNNAFFEQDFGGNKFLVEKPTIRTPVRLRCSCSDAYFRWNWYNWEKAAIFGSKPRPYVRKTTTRASVNAKHLPGICKHMINSYLLIETSGLTRPGTLKLRG